MNRVTVEIPEPEKWREFATGEASVFGDLRTALIDAGIDPDLEWSEDTDLFTVSIEGDTREVVEAITDALSKADIPAKVACQDFEQHSTFKVYSPCPSSDPA